MNNPLSVAARGKGILNTALRAVKISQRYGMSPRKMDRILSHFAQLLKEYECGATFPIVTAALARSKGVAEKYKSDLIEFAIHGYYHIDHKLQPLEVQKSHFKNAREIFEAQGLSCSGFRCPYLRWNEDTLTAIRAAGLLYDTSQVVAWDVAKDAETDSYRRVLGFYGAVLANDYPALPRYDQDLVRIPYCVPDDEALIERLEFPSPDSKNKPWLEILDQTHRRGELFTLGLHPERILMCEEPLRMALEKARRLSPSVWFARLDAIARWWLDRMNAEAAIADDGNGIKIDVRGPEGVTILARNVEVNVETKDWDGVYRLVNGISFTVRSERRPVVGVTPKSDPYLNSFLRQQGYILEVSEVDRNYSFFLDRSKFEYRDELALLDEIENSRAPLIRMGRWPHGAKSALCVTGDIDALTVWDYWLRFLGK